MAGPSERSDTLTRSGGLGWYEFFGQGQRIVGDRRVGVSGEAGEGLKY